MARRWHCMRSACSCPGASFSTPGARCDRASDWDAACAAAAGARHPGCSTGGAGDVLRVRYGQARLLKNVCAILDDGFRIEEQKSEVAIRQVDTSKNLVL